MEAVRKIISADTLKKISSKKLKGCLNTYANPALWEKEQYAWGTNIIEKYGNI